MKSIASSAFALLLAASGNSFAESTFNMKIKDGSLADAAKLVNSFCEKEIEPIELENPTETVSLNFEDIGCKAAAKLIKDFDAGAKA
ncbi:hypothetical protein SAMN04487965_1631 [Microbulbifer donghaiensis]|uniref:HMA domain-containing protein n=1 Tax=Microbulbifer donghaiensis TaxID=494016 RepID=A0A1M4ZRT0_9GAMM|nr:hypothetical protein [Microbulbifer donghaiensis]SHF20800.1 hypothetical protein SAMN04487965_1631 [Microbulbifer donghaiensis]